MLCSTTAHAQDLPAAEAVESLDLVAPEVLDDAVPIEVADLAGGNAELESGSGTVTVPADPEEGVSLTTRTGDVLALGLPFADDADHAHVTDDLLAYDNNNGSTTVPVVKDDGGIQVTTVISTESAPVRYDYQLAVPDGSVVSELDNGTILVTAVDGSLVGGVAPAWAVDAAGTPVPTRYELTAEGFVQIVEHQGPGTVYPVVADPFLGNDLFSWTGYNRNGTYNGQVVVSMLKSNWGNLVWTGALLGVASAAAGQAIFQTSGWQELVAKRPQADDKPTLQHQYDCHVLYGFNIAGAGVHWDLEKARPNNSIWAVQDPRLHRCNW